MKKFILIFAGIVVIIVMVVAIVVAALAFLPWSPRPDPTVLFLPRDKVKIGVQMVDVFDPQPAPVGWDCTFQAWNLLATEEGIKARVSKNWVMDNRFWLLTREDPQLAQIIALAETFPEFEKIKPLLNKLLSSKDCLHSYEYLDVRSQELLCARLWICDPPQKILIYVHVKK